MKQLLIFLLGMMLYNCTPKITESLITKDVQKTDSTHIHKDSTSYRDSTLQIKGSTITIQGNVSIDSNGKASMHETVTETEHSKASASIINGKLLVDCKCKDLELTVQLQQRLIQDYKIKTALNKKEQIIYREKEVRYIPEWVKWLAGFGALSILYFLFKAFKFIYKLFI